MMSSSRDIELAWAAGLFEGEGCITGRRGGSDIAVVISMADEDVLRRFHAIVGCGTLLVQRRVRPEHHKTQWRWQANGDDAESVVGALLPHLCARRTARAMEMLRNREEWRDRVLRNQTCKHCGSTYDRTASSQRYCSRTCQTRAADEAYRRRSGAVPRGTATHCRNGHRYTERDTHVSPHGWRICRACDRAKSARYVARKKAAA